MSRQGPSRLDAAGPNFIAHHARVVRGTRFIIRYPDQQGRAARGGNVEHCGGVARQSSRQVHHADPVEPALPVVREDAQLAAAPGADNQVIQSIAVEVGPADAGAKLAEPFGQQHLPLKVIERFFVVAVAQQVADVGEQGGGDCRLPIADCQLPIGRCGEGRGAGFVDLVEVVGFDVGED